MEGEDRVTVHFDVGLKSHVSEHAPMFGNLLGT